MAHRAFQQLSLLAVACGLVANRREFALELAATWEPLTGTYYQFEQRHPLVRDLAPAPLPARCTAE